LYLECAFAGGFHHVRLVLSILISSRILSTKPISILLSYISLTRENEDKNLLISSLANTRLTEKPKATNHDEDNSKQSRKGLHLLHPNP
jgi:hypothetical protein